MSSYKLFSHSESLVAMIREMQGLFHGIIPLDIKRDMAAILFPKLGKIIIRLTFLEPYIFCANLINLAAIFQVSEHLNNFKITAYGGHFVFQNAAKIFYRHVFIAINIPCTFGEDIFGNE